VYQKLQNLFIEAYQAVPKFGWQCNIETQEKVTPKMFNELIAEQYRQTFPKEYLHFLKVLKESGALTDKNLERIRAANRRRERKYSPIDTSPLIAELDGLVMNFGQYREEEKVTTPNSILLPKKPDNQKNPCFFVGYLK
jgi:hypothetical protein